MVFIDCFQLISDESQSMFDERCTLLSGDGSVNSDPLPIQYYSGFNKHLCSEMYEILLALWEVANHLLVAMIGEVCVLYAVAFD